MKKMILRFVLIGIIFISCSKKESPVKPEPEPKPVNKTATANLSAVNYIETVDGVHKYKCTFTLKSYNNKACTIYIEKGVGDDFKPSKTYASGTTHTEIISYTSFGSFNVTLNIKDPEGNTASSSKEITVSKKTPAIVSKGSYSNTEAEIENGVITNIQKYKWAFKVTTTDNVKYKITLKGGNDNNLTPTEDYESGKEYEILIPYTKLGTFNSELIVTDAKGNKGTFSEEITVIDRTPVVEFTIEYLDFNVSTKIYRYKYSYKVTTNEASKYKTSFNYGGTAPIATEEEFESGTLYSEKTIGYSTLGDYDLNFEVTDLNGNKGLVTRKLEVKGTPPKLTFSIDPAVLVREASASGTIYSYKCLIKWSVKTESDLKYSINISDDLGERLTLYTTDHVETGTFFNYPTPGTYTIKVRVWTNLSDEIKESFQVTIKDMIPTANDPVGLFEQPYVHMAHGLLEKDFYGSGDVNQDEKIDSKDAALIRSGTANKYTDINRDGSTNEEDAQCIDEGMDNKWLTLANDYWNQSLSIPERTEFCKRSAKLSRDSYFKSKMEGYWICATYSDQCIIHLQGLVDPDSFLGYWYSPAIIGNYVWNPMINSDNNAWYNLRVYDVGVIIDNSSLTAHSIMAFPVGNDLSALEGWLFLDTFTGTVVTPGSLFMKAGHTIGIAYVQNTKEDYDESKGVMERTPNADGTWSNTKSEAGKLVPCWIHPDIKSLQNPNQ